MKSATRILAIWLPNWPVQRLIRARPELERQPLILVERTPRGQCAAACSHAAGQLGVQPEMPLAEAAALAQQRPNGAPPLYHELYDPLADRRELEKLAAWCQRFSPVVGLEDDDPPETLLLDVGGIAALFGGEEALGEQVTLSFQRQRLAARLGWGNSVGAAWAMAHYGPQQPAVPAAQGILPALPTAALRLPADIVAVLASLGLSRIGDLIPLPRAELQCRFGSLLLKRLDQALGGAAEVINAVHPSPDFTVEQWFEYPVEQRSAINQAIRRLIERLCFLLLQHNEGVLQLTGRLDCQGAPSAAWDAGCFRATADVGHLLKLVELRLERLRLPAPVTGISLCAARHARLIPRQQQLFDREQLRQDSPQLASLIDRLAGRLGRQAVVRCVLQSDAQPEKTVRYEPLAGGPAPRGGKIFNTPFLPLDRPLRLLREPIPLQVDAAEPEGPPLSFQYRGLRRQVLRHWGPERIETGWWRRRGIRRDYYRVETAEGFRFWLFRCLRMGRWFLHGMFD